MLCHHEDEDVLDSSDVEDLEVDAADDAIFLPLGATTAAPPPRRITRELDAIELLVLHALNENGFLIDPYIAPPPLPTEPPRGEKEARAYLRSLEQNLTLGYAVILGRYGGYFPHQHSDYESREWNMAIVHFIRNASIEAGWPDHYHFLVNVCLPRDQPQWQPFPVPDEWCGPQRPTNYPLQRIPPRLTKKQLCQQRRQQEQQEQDREQERQRLRDARQCHYATSSHQQQPSPRPPHLPLQTPQQPRQPLLPLPAPRPDHRPTATQARGAARPPLAPVASTSASYSASFHARDYREKLQHTGRPQPPTPRMRASRPGGGVAKKTVGRSREGGVGGGRVENSREEQRSLNQLRLRQLRFDKSVMDGLTDRRTDQRKDESKKESTSSTTRNLCANSVQGEYPNLDYFSSKVAPSSWPGR